MRKINSWLVIALVAMMLAGFIFGRVGRASAQEVPPMGVVVDFQPGQSITVVDQSGVQHEYMISSTLKILPPVRANALTVGSFVTIIAPASLSHGKELAVGIVVHPHIPNGWNIPLLSATASATDTAVGTSTATPSGTIVVTDTAAAAETASAMQLATDTPADTPTAAAAGTATVTPAGGEAATETPSATATPTGGETTAPATTLMEWLRSLFQQILTSR